MLLLVESFTGNNNTNRNPPQHTVTPSHIHTHNPTHTLTLMQGPIFMNIMHGQTIFASTLYCNMPDEKP